MITVLAKADTLTKHGVVRHEPVGRDLLVERIAAARVMLYRAHQRETFCLALAEAQALGVPCVVQPIGSAAERVRDGVTGFVADDDKSFARRAVELLTDDALFAEMSVASARLQRSRSWDDVARDFVALMVS
jgi:glycosyltransferase involved in cell wall biosynthesis